MRGQNFKHLLAGAVLAVAVLAHMQPANGEPVPRNSPAAGSVIARKTGEEIRFVDVSSWRFVDLQQDLLNGDVLRTNATGQLAILFADHTQVRLGRNTSLSVKYMGSGGDTVLSLQAGTIWARAERGGQGLTVETPAAAAAIRGTDWTLSVDGRGQTSLVVLDGLVELKNDLGSVEVGKGEAAVAAIGERPRKLVIVDPKDREQMLFYLTLRNAFVFLPATPLPMPRMPVERDRIVAIPENRRSADDWLALAEIQLSLDGRQQAIASLQQARALGLSRSQTARADLIDALIAGAENRHSDAARLFAKALPNLDGERRDIAAFGGYFARSLADPRNTEKPPASISSPYGAIADAYATGFLQNTRAGLEALRKAEKRFPDDAAIPAVRGYFALLLDDRAELETAIERALALDPNNQFALDVRASYRANIKGDLTGALADLTLALETSPGSTSLWNSIGLVQLARDDYRSAEASLTRAIALDPQDPVAHANLAILYLDQLRVADAKREIDAAIAADPSFDIALVARGRYHIQTGELDKAVDDLLAATVANPAYAQGELLLAAARYEKGDRVAGAQAVDNAARLDPNDPVVASMQTTIAIDEYRSNDAIRYAQEFLRRSRARGGHFATLSASQDAGSSVNNAFRLQGLNAWGQFYGDAVFDPFAGTGYFDQAIRGSVNPFANAFLFGNALTDFVPNETSFSSFIQGLLYDPHVFGPSRAPYLLNRPFFEASIGNGIIAAGSEQNWTGEAEIQGYSNTPIPVSMYANVEFEKTPLAGEYGGNLDADFEGDIRILSGNGYLTASPTPNDRLVFYGNYAKNDLGIRSSGIPLEVLPPPFPLFEIAVDRDDSLETASAGLGWSHTLGYRNVVNAALFYTEFDAQSIQQGQEDLPGTPTLFRQTDRAHQRNYIGAINHTYGDGDLTWRYGAEGGLLDVKASQVIENFLFPDRSEVAIDRNIGLARGYVDLLHEITPDLKAEYGLFLTSLHGGGIDVDRLEPRIGAAWMPAEGQWLRAAFMRSGLEIGTPTLAPIGTLGIQPNQFAFGNEGYSDTLAFRWDAEWTENLFTAIDFQHQELHDLSIAMPLTIPLVVEAVGVSRGRVDFASATANLVLGHGFGLSATAAIASSENRDPSSLGYGNSLPFIPDTAGQVALTWVSDINLKTTVAANYVGERDGDVLGNELDDYWTLDASLTFEPFDKRFELELTAYNLLNEDFEVAPDVPGWGRAFKGTLTMRF